MAAAKVPGGQGLGVFNPCVDGVALPRDPFSPDAPPLSADVPVLVGTNKDEATLFLFADPRFRDNVERLKNRKALIALLEQEFGRRPAAEWVDLLLAAGVPAAPIQNYEEALDCEQARARDMVVEGEHPVEGKVKMLGFPVKLRGTPQQIRRVAPLLGAHTAEVFSELGLSAERIEQLQAAGAFGARDKAAVAA